MLRLRNRFPTGLVLSFLSCLLSRLLSFVLSLVLSSLSLPFLKSLSLYYSASLRQAAFVRALSTELSPPLHYDDAFIKGVLDRTKTVAIVGASTNSNRPSYFAMKYLQEKGCVVANLFFFCLVLSCLASSRVGVCGLILRCVVLYCLVLHCIV
jgi:hypothetical protein